MIPYALDPTLQRGNMDCGVACVAMLAGRPYREASETALRLSPTVHRSGMWNAELVRTAEALGLTLRTRTRAMDMGDEPTGILRLKKAKHVDTHYVVLFQGVVVNPADGLIWDLDTYLSKYHFRITAFLEVTE